MASKTAKKTAKTANKVEMTETLNKITETAKSVNTQIRQTAVEVLEDVTEAGKDLRERATTRVKTAIDGIDINKGIETVKTTAKDINTYTLGVAENIVEGALTTGKEWQGVAEKAIKGGLNLAEKQQDILFNALEDVKGQVKKGAGRVRTLMTNN